MRNLLIIGMLPLLVFSVSMLSSEARVNSVSSGLDIGLDIDRRTNKGDETNAAASQITIHEDYNKFVTTPFFQLKSEDIKDSMNFKYAPGLKHDLDGKGDKIDQKLDFSARRMPIKEWKITISELYINTDDSTQTITQSLSGGENIAGGSAGGTGDQISNELGRRRFWNNSAALFSEYTYLQDSIVSLGYTYSVLRNDDLSTFGNYQDYDKHAGVFSASYRFLHDWKAVVGGQLIRGLFHPEGETVTAIPSNDLVQYIGNATLESLISSKSTLSLAYEYTGTKYDNTIQNDNDIHQGILTWKREVSPRISYAIGGGPSYAKTELRESKWGYNANASFKYAVTEHGKFDFGIKKDINQDTFSGTSTGGYIDSWQLNGGLDYEISQGLSCKLFASFKDENHQNAFVSTSDNNARALDATLQDTYTLKKYSSGFSLQYKFWEKYTASAGYTFSRQDSDNTQVSVFDEHRIYLTLGFQKEFFRW